MATVIEIGRDFSRTPGGRLISDGPFSGQLFRDRTLAPALKDAVARGEKVTVVLDGPRGYLSSFLEEAFGGLVRFRVFDQKQLSGALEIVARDPFYEPYKHLALRYISEAKPSTVAAG
ncbi:STAS-like domain-containing protein [Bradyrhizobium lupini]|uniref:STAS-like domain-containing protein n=1 Tax=Rhizobium lupini TaxID=136996 RepID=UPI0034C66E75